MYFILIFLYIIYIYIYFIFMCLKIYIFKKENICIATEIKGNFSLSSPVQKVCFELTSTT